MTDLGNINQKIERCQNASLDFTKLEKCTHCLLNFMKLVVILGASLLTLNYSSPAETHNFARITLRFLFLWEGKKKNCISQVLSSSRACNHHRQWWKEMPWVTGQLRSGSLFCYIPYLMQEAKANFFFFFMTTPRSEKRTVLITPDSSQLESQKFLHVKSKNNHLKKKKS